MKEKPYDLIVIEAHEEEAIDYFIRKFGHDPRDVACECCGSNYSIGEYESFKGATDGYVPLNCNTLVIRKEDMT